MKIFYKKFMGFISFFVILFSFVFYISDILRPKNYMDINMKVFVRQKIFPDVVAIGSSHIHWNFQPSVLYRKFGIPMYDVSSPGLTIVQSYFFAKEVLRHGKPKLMIFELSDVLNENIYVGKQQFINASVNILNPFDYLLYSIAEVNPEEFISYFLQLPLYHQRYSELVQGDFNYKKDIFSSKKDWKGEFTSLESNPTNMDKFVYNTDKKYEILKNKEKYLLKIIKLCKKNKIPILFVLTPIPMDETLRGRYNAIAEIATENNIPILNVDDFLSEIPFDYEKDFFNPTHLTKSGSIKFSEFLGNYLNKHYVFDDRRNDEMYRSYAINADNFLGEENN